MYALWMETPPDNELPFTFTHWCHEDREPYRVIVSENPDSLLRNLIEDVEVRVYTGDEPTVTYQELVTSVTKGVNMKLT